MPARANALVASKQGVPKWNVTKQESVFRIVLFARWSKNEVSLSSSAKIRCRGQARVNLDPGYDLALFQNFLQWPRHGPGERDKSEQLLASQNGTVPQQKEPKSSRSAVPTTNELKERSNKISGLLVCILVNCAVEANKSNPTRCKREPPLVL